MPSEDIFAPAWQKIPFLLEQLNKLQNKKDRIVWIDADVLILNPRFPIAEYLSTEKDLLFSLDAFGICTGVFAARNTQWTRDFLNALWLLRAIDPTRQTEFDGRDTWEQNSIKALLRYFPNLRAHCGHMSESIVQNRLSKFSANAWLYHLWMEGRTSADMLRRRQYVSEHGWTRATFKHISRFDHQSWTHVAKIAGQIGITKDELLLQLGLQPTLHSHSGDLALSQSESDVLVRAGDLFTITLCRFRNKDQAAKWLTTIHKSLGRLTPLQYAKTESGFYRARTLLDTIFRLQSAQ